MNRFGVPAPSWRSMNLVFAVVGLAVIVLVPLQALSLSIAPRTAALFATQLPAVVIAFNLWRDFALRGRCRQQLSAFSDQVEAEWPSRLYDDCLAGLPVNAAEFDQAQQIELGRVRLRRNMLESRLLWEFSPLSLVPLTGLLAVVTNLPGKAAFLPGFVELFGPFIVTVAETVVLGWIAAVQLVGWLNWLEDWSRASLARIAADAKENQRKREAVRREAEQKEEKRDGGDNLGKGPVSTQFEPVAPLPAFGNSFGDLVRGEATVPNESIVIAEPAPNQPAPSSFEDMKRFL